MKFDWRDAFPEPPENACLIAALWTSFQPVNASFMASQVLPSLLGLKREEGSDSEEEAWFTADLIQRLAPLRGRLTVVTSPPRPGSHAESEINWLWNYVTPYWVGHDQGATQHAKLWLYHWKAYKSETGDRNDREWLQICISSTNLTQGAISGQIQAGVSFKAEIKRDAAQVNNRQFRDALHDFLGDLGKSACCSNRTEFWQLLLANTILPENIDLIASTPYRSPFKAMAKRRSNSIVRIFAPFLGNWKSADIIAWKAEIAGPKSGIELIWPPSDHPWCASQSLNRDDDGQRPWALFNGVYNELIAAGVSIRAFQSNAPIKGQESAGEDRRWGHAKVYGVNGGVVVGSHNWSSAAWGKSGGTLPTNFELSVWMPEVVFPVYCTGRLLARKELCLIPGAPTRNEGTATTWVWAEWNGTKLTVNYRVSSKASLSWGENAACCIGNRLVTGSGSVKIQTKDRPHVLKLVVVETREEIVIPVLFIGDAAVTDESGRNTGATVSDRADRVLIEQFGGPSARLPDGGSRANRNSNTVAGAGDNATYQVDWLLAAKLWTDVVDNWRDRYGVSADEYSKSLARLLAGAIQRLGEGDVGARVAVEELMALSESRDAVKKNRS